MKTYEIDNGHVRAVFLDYGARLHQLWVKDKKGTPVNVIAGLPKPEDYYEDRWYRGAIVGRYAGRLENPLPVGEPSITIENDEGLLLHCGTSGWSGRHWELVKHTPDGIQWSIKCQDGSSGFPGTVVAQVSYRLENNALQLVYKATTSRPTPINLTNHAYFNLHPQNPIALQHLQIFADQYLALKDNLVPTGALLEVTNTPLDFRTAHAIDNGLLDDCFVLKQEKAARLFAPATGICMTTYTDQPGLVVFTPKDFYGICFETQKFSNGPHHSHFPDTLLKPGSEYTQQTTFSFTVENDL